MDGQSDIQKKRELMQRRTAIRRELSGYYRTPTGLLPGFLTEKIIDLWEELTMVENVLVEDYKIKIKRITEA